MILFEARRTKHGDAGTNKVQTPKTLEELNNDAANVFKFLPTCTCALQKFALLFIKCIAHILVVLVVYQFDSFLYNSFFFTGGKVQRLKVRSVVENILYQKASLCQ